MIAAVFEAFFAAAVLVAQTQPAEIPALNASLGSCAAAFTVTDANGKPIYNASIHTRIRYGLMNVKRMDLEVNTNTDGKARIIGLPGKAQPVTYEVKKDAKTTTVGQKVA